MSTKTLSASLMARRCLAAPALLLFALRSYAAEGEAPGVSGSAIVQMLSGLALIIGILFVAAYLVRQINGGQRFGQSGPLRIVGGLSISARERIVVVEVGETWLVVGVVPGQIKTLHTLPRGELPAGGGEKPFTHWLRQMTERKP